MSTDYCGAVSRVLSFKMIIYLGRSLPTASSNLPGDETGRLMVSIFGLASDGVYTATTVTSRTVVSYTAFSPLRRRRLRFLSRNAAHYAADAPSLLLSPQMQASAGALGRRCFFLLHFPGSHLRRTLSGILPFEARTFLVRLKPSAIIRPTISVLFILFCLFYSGHSIS